MTFCEVINRSLFFIHLILKIFESVPAWISIRLTPACPQSPVCPATRAYSAAVIFTQRFHGNIEVNLLDSEVTNIQRIPAKELHIQIVRTQFSFLGCPFEIENRSEFNIDRFPDPGGKFREATGARQQYLTTDTPTDQNLLPHLLYFEGTLYKSLEILFPDSRIIRFQRNLDLNPLRENVFQVYQHRNPPEAE